MTLTSGEGIVSRDCVVCGNDAGDPNAGGGGDRLLVYHYSPDHACGYLIHENCRYRDDAPNCPCGDGRAEEGLTREAVDALHPASDSAVNEDYDFDESIPREGVDY
jgi:hypothetical protein